MAKTKEVKQDKKEKQLQELLALTEQSEGVKKEYVLEHFGVSVRTAENMKKTLCQRGYKIENSGKGKGVWWRNKAEEEQDGNIMTEVPSTELNARAAVYLFLLQSAHKTYTKEELFQVVRGLDCDSSAKKLYASQSENYNRVIHKLLEEKQIKITKKGSTEYVELTEKSNRLIPVMSMQGDEDEAAYDLLKMLQDYTGKLDKNLDRVKDKLEILVSGEIEERIKSYEVRGRSKDTSKIINEITTKLGNSDYEKNAIRVIFKKTNGTTAEKKMKVGIAYYSKIQDKVYILGEELEEDKKTVIIVSNIQEVETLEEKNDVYFSQKYLDIFDKMFGASYDEEQAVEVHFSNFGSIPDKIKQLVKSRKYASYTIENDKLIYTDTIIGMREFAAYLRQYGRSCEVKKPESLRDEMKKSPDRVLDRYKQEGVYTYNE